MKTKKVLLLTTMFLFIIALMVIKTNKVFATDTMSDELKQILNDEGKLVVNSVEPKDSSEAWLLVYEDKLMEVEGIWVDWDGAFNEDFTKVTIYYGNHGDTSKSCEVEIVYNYDKDIKAIVDEMVEKLPEDKTKFELTGLEYINYLLYNYESEEYINLGDFSGELKKAINYRNFNIIIDTRAGADTYFSNNQMGIAKIQYDNTTYYIEQTLGVTAKHIFYVDDNVTDVKKAVEDRIFKEFGNVNIEVFDGEETIGEFLDHEKAMYQTEYRRYKNMIDTYSSADDYADAMGFGAEDPDRQYAMDDYWRAYNAIDNRTEEEYVYGHMNDYEFLNEIRDAEVYVLCMEDGLNVSFAVVKDSSKVNEVNDNLNYATNDVKTNITISSASSTLPLDTIIKAAKLTSGAEYDKIMNVLGVSNSVTYDLSLYSSSADKYITKLENDKFSVKIPISAELEGKELIAYYVTGDEKIEEHEVTTKDGYATFETDHFSIYTIAEKKADDNKEENTGNIQDNGNKEENTGNMPDNDNKEENTGNAPSGDNTNTDNNTDDGTNPKTGDNILLFVRVLLIAVIGIAATTKFLKPYKNEW